MVAGTKAGCRERRARLAPEDEDRRPIDDGCCASHILAKLQNAHCCNGEKDDDQKLLSHTL